MIEFVCRDDPQTHISPFSREFPALSRNPCSIPGTRSGLGEKRRRLVSREVFFVNWLHAHRTHVCAPAAAAAGRHAVCKPLMKSQWSEHPRVGRQAPRRNIWSFWRPAFRPRRASDKHRAPPPRPDCRATITTRVCVGFCAECVWEESGLAGKFIIAAHSARF